MVAGKNAMKRGSKTAKAEIVLAKAMKKAVAPAMNAMKRVNKTAKAAAILPTKAKKAAKAPAMKAMK